MTDKNSDAAKQKIFTVMQSMDEVLAAHPACDAPDHDAPASNELAAGGCSNPNCLKFKGLIFLKSDF
jgi:hypothetical protein